MVNDSNQNNAIVDREKGNNLQNKLAISLEKSDVCADANSLEPEPIKCFCQVWGEVGRAILNRRDKGDNAQGKTRFDYPGGCLHQSV